MKIIKSATLLFVVILLFSFSVFNMHSVRVSFFAWRSPELPLFLILIFAFALGGVAAALWGALRTSRHSRRQKKTESGKKTKQGHQEMRKKNDSGEETKHKESEGSEETKV